jgi:hypothetical protein|nr:MAG TPA: hypothetical protein [Caudoviricetes sp.]
MESYVKLSTEKYEELAKKCLMLDVLAESYKKMPSYRFDDVLEVYFGKRETAEKEYGKC